MNIKYECSEIIVLTQEKRPKYLIVRDIRYYASFIIVLFLNLSMSVRGKTFF